MLGLDGAAGSARINESETFFAISPPRSTSNRCDTMGEPSGKRKNENFYQILRRFFFIISKVSLFKRRKFNGDVMFGFDCFSMLSYFFTRRIEMEIGKTSELIFFRPVERCVDRTSPDYDEKMEKLAGNKVLKQERGWRARFAKKHVALISIPGYLRMRLTTSSPSHIRHLCIREKKVKERTP